MRSPEEDFHGEAQGIGAYARKGRPNSRHESGLAQPLLEWQERSKSPFLPRDRLTLGGPR